MLGFPVCTDHSERHHVYVLLKYFFPSEVTVYIESHPAQWHRRYIAFVFVCFVGKLFDVVAYKLIGLC